MTKRVEIVKGKDGRQRYRVPGEVPVDLVRVSGVVDMMPKPALVGAAVKEAAAYSVRKRDDLIKLPKTEHFEAVKSAHDKVWGAKAALGTEAHEAAELYMHAVLRGEKPKFRIRSEIMPFLKNLVRWQREYDVEPVWLERLVVNETVRYAGRLDGLYRLTLPSRGRVLAVVDTKTGASGVWAAAALQQTAYVHAEYSMKDEETGELEPMPDDIVGAFALWLRPNGYSMIPLDTGDTTWAQFKRLRETLDWSANHEKTAVGKPINSEPLRRQWTPPNLG